MPVSPESSSSDLTVERDAALARLAALPQAAHLPPETRRQWLDHQLERLREESAGSAGRGGSLSLDRQIERLSGFGASEIGVLVGERRGEYSPFATAREICAAKLLRALPAPPTGPMQRGVELEPHVTCSCGTAAPVLSPICGRPWWRTARATTAGCWPRRTTW